MSSACEDYFVQNWWKSRPTIIMTSALDEMRRHHLIPLLIISKYWPLIFEAAFQRWNDVKLHSKWAWLKFFKVRRRTIISTCDGQIFTLPTDAIATELINNDEIFRIHYFHKASSRLYICFKTLILSLFYWEHLSVSMNFISRKREKA